MDYQSYLSQKYQGHESFLENIIFPIFGEDNYESAWDVELLDSEELRGQAAKTGIRSIIRCGTINLDLTPIEVFDITVSDRLMMEKNRVGVQAVIRRVMDTYSGSFMLIHYDNDTKWDWRFTFCQLKDKNEFTDSKRYTFLLGPSQSCRTAAQNFQKLADLNQIITIKDIQTAFDVEALSKEFFGKYKNHYERFVEYITGKRFVKEGGKFVEKTNHEPHPVYYEAFGNNDKAVRDYVKLTLGRIILMHFVQKKGWLGVPVGEKWGNGDEQFMRNLFVKASAEQKDDFLESVLEPLFFDAIDTDRRDSGDIFDTKVVGKVRIPYLNGGLFEKNKEDEVIVRFPAEFFSDLLEFFSEYNFTIDENDPNEAQVGIDPEMLSQIFENLLEDNKDKGAFYTPKEIVKYMCQESLIAYLNTKTGFEEEKLRRFVHNPDIVVKEFSETEKENLLDAILSVKICDPAIGSGAFPIGLLNELVRCKEAIFGDEKGRADIKREIIRDNIYGVDIEKGAVDIARLRFWLSLVVDEEEPTPLPNLDFKIMQGNSLLEWYEGVDLSHLADNKDEDLFLSSATQDKDQLSKLLKLYFNEDNHEKKAILKEEISTIIKSLLSLTQVHIPLNMNVASNMSFFLWHTWFKEVFDCGGFDIVAGNPPYISSQSQVENETLLSQRNQIIKTGQYSSLYQKWDLYIPFMELGLQITREKDGIFSMIVPYPLTNQLYGQKIRKMLIHDYHLFELVDLNGTKIFNNATVSNCIPFVRKCAHTGDTNISHIDDKGNIHRDYCLPSHILEQDEQKRVWNLTQEVRDTTRHSEMHVLGDYCYLSYGLRPNSDEKSAKGVFKKGDLISEAVDSIPRREYLEAKDINKYQITRVRYLEYGTDRSPALLTRPTFDELYSCPKLMFNVLGRLTGTIDEQNRVHNHSLIACVLWKDIAGVNNKSISSSIQKFSSMSRYQMSELSKSVDLKYLLGILNSKYANELLALQRGGDYHIYPEHLRKIPIAPASNDEQDAIVKLVDKILISKKNNPNANTSDIEAEIDRIVYELYNIPVNER